MAAIISDTLMFRSPTCTSIARAAAEKLSEICGVEIEEFAIDMFSAGSDMSSRTPKEIFNQDKKKFQVGDHGFIVSQINSMNAIELEEIKRIYEEYYADHSFTFLTDKNPDLKQVVNTNKCLLYLQKIEDRLLIVSMIDNLLKGASGQAVHNMNLMFGLEETVGLHLKPSAF